MRLRLKLIPRLLRMQLNPLSSHPSLYLKQLKKQLKHLMALTGLGLFHPNTQTKLLLQERAPH